MKIFNKFIWSKKEPSNKNDIWFDGSTWRIYTEKAWQSFTLPVDAADKVSEMLEDISEVYQEKLTAGEGIVIEDNEINLTLKTVNGESIIGEGNIIIESSTPNAVESEEVASTTPTPEFPYATKGELTELSAEVSELSEKIENLPTAEAEVFEAKFKETTYEEVKAAFEAKKVVYCHYDARVYSLSTFAYNVAYFSVILGDYHYRLAFYPSNPKPTWGADSKNFTHKLETLENGNAKITIAGKTAEVATPQYVQNLLGTIINGDY